MVCILLGEGFEEVEALVPADLLRRAGLTVCLAGLSGREVTGSHGITVRADAALEDVDAGEIELLFLPGGMGGVASIRNCPAALDLIRETHARGAFLAAICAAPTILGEMGLLKGRRAVCYPGMESALTGAEVCCGQGVVVDGRLVTGEAAGSALPFALTLASLLRSPACAREVAEAIHYHGTF